MSKIFTGLLFILLDFNLQFGGSKLDILPDFIGYLCIAAGASEMAYESAYFNKMKLPGVVMGIYTALLFFIELAGGSGIPIFPLQIISELIFLYISYCLCQAVLDIESAKKITIGGSELMSRWKVLAVLEIITAFLVILPLLGSLTIFMIIADLIVYIIFLIYFKKVKDNYYTLSPQG